jgi:small subunit ribosomal protein S10
VQLLDRFAAVSLHAAGALGISCNNIAHLPTQRTLWTVPKSPFVHKGAQENFERRVHKRAIKVFDADPEVVERWVRFLHQHSEGGVGMRVVRWDRAPVGVGRTALKNVNEALDTKKLTKGKIQQLGEKIVEQESAVVAGQGASDAKAKEVVIPAKEAEPKAAKS